MGVERVDEIAQLMLSVGKVLMLGQGDFLSLDDARPDSLDDIKCLEGMKIRLPVSLTGKSIQA